MALKPLLSAYSYSSSLRLFPRFSTTSSSHSSSFLTLPNPRKTALIPCSRSSSSNSPAVPSLLKPYQSEPEEEEDEDEEQDEEEDYLREDSESESDSDLGELIDHGSETDPESELESDLFQDELLEELDGTVVIQIESDVQNQNIGLSNSDTVHKLLEIARNSPADVNLGGKNKLGDLAGEITETDCITALQILIKEGLVKECLYFIKWMLVQEDPVLLTARALLVALPALGRANMSEEIVQLIGELPKERRFRDARIYNSAILALARCGRYDDAWQVYQMLESNNVRPDHITCYILITIMRRTRGKTAKDAWNLFQSMTRRGAEWSLQSVLSLIKLFCQEGLKREALIIISEMERRGILSDARIYDTLMECYVKYSEVERAEGLFREMKERGVKPSITSYNVLMDGYSKRMQPEVVENLMSELRSLGLVPDVISYTCLISAYGRKKDCSMANDAFLRMIREGIIPNSHAYTALVHSYAISGLHEKAYITYQSMVTENIKPSIETYSALLNVFRRAGDAEKVMEIWKYMMGNKIEATRVTYDIVLDCLAKNGLYVQAREVIYEYSKLGLNPTTMTYNMLINAYTKGGQCSKIPVLLKEMATLELTPDSITYLTIVHAYIRVGDFIKAFYFYKSMVKKGLVPDYKSGEKLRAILQNKAKIKNVRDRSAILGILNSKFVKERKRGKKDEFWKNKKRRIRIDKFPGDFREKDV